MRKSKTVKLSEALTDYIREMQFEGRLREVDVLNSWEEIAGKAIAKRTRKVTFYKGTLFVHLTSAVVRHELMLIREGLKDRINNSVGSEVVHKIVLR